MAERSEIQSDRFLAHLTSQSIVADSESIFQGGFQQPQIMAFSVESNSPLFTSLNEAVDQTRTSSDQSKGSGGAVEAQPKDRSAALNEIADPKLRGALNRALKSQDEADEKGVNKKTRYRLLMQAVGNYSDALDLMARQNEGEKDVALESAIHNGIGVAYGIIGRSDDAIDRFGKAIKIDPDNAIAHYNYGVVCIQSGKIDADAYHSLGVGSMLRGNADEGVKNLKKAIDLGSKNSDTFLYLATYYTQIGDLDQTIAYLKKAVNISPKDAKLYHRLGIAYGESKNPNKAIENFEIAVKINPNDAGIYYSLGVAYSLVGNRKKAIEYGHMSIDLNPDFADALFNLGNEYIREREFDTAIKYLKRAIEKGPRRIDAYMNLSYAYEKSNRSEDAIECCLKALAINPENIVAHHNLGIAYARADNLEAALESSLQAIRMKPDFAAAYMGRSFIYLIKREQDEAAGQQDEAADQMNEAAEDFAVALSLNPERYQEYADIFADVLRKIEEDEAPWNELRAALIQAQSDAEHEQPEGWTTLLNSALEAVDKLAPLRKDIRRLNRAAKYLAVEECRDVRTELGYVLNEALDRLGSLAAFQRETARHALSMEASGEEKDGFAAALLRLNRSLDAIKIEEVNDDFLKIRADNSMQTLRYLQTRIKTGGRKFTWEEANER